MVGTNPFSGLLEMFRFLNKGEPNLSEKLRKVNMSEEGIELIEQCLKEQPEERLTARKALNHRWSLKGNLDSQISEALWQQLVGNEHPARSDPSDEYVSLL